MKICIVGGVAGGAGAATRARRLDEHAEIILFEKGEFISYANCGLPYYIGGTINNRDALIVTKPELLRKRFRVDVRTGNEVMGIDPEKKLLRVRELESGREYAETYDKLILSPGAEPRSPRMEGLDQEGVFALRNVTDTYRIYDYLEAKRPRNAVVIGGGFIGLEIAENLKERGLSVRIVEFADQVAGFLDHEMANILHNHLAEKGIELLLKTGAEGIRRTERGLEMSLSTKETIETDIVVLGIGVVPESSLAQKAGLELSIGGSIKVNEYYETSAQDIYAVGDAIAVTHFVSGRESLIPLAGPANKQGRIAAENAIYSGKAHDRKAESIETHDVKAESIKTYGVKAEGWKVRGSRVQGSSVLKLFDLTAAATGMNEKQLLREGMKFLKTYVHPQSHAGYYPGSTPISMKLLFAEDGKLLGAQAVGYEGVEKRIDVLAAALRLGGTVYDLEELELCYAPPYSSAKDPVNMLGFTAANILKGDMPVFYAEELASTGPEGIQLIDVSTPDEVLMGTVEGSRNIPLDELRDRLDGLDREKPVYVFCRVGLRGYIATRILLQSGYDVKNMSGGYKTYRLVTDTRFHYGKACGSETMAAGRADRGAVCGNGGRALAAGQEAGATAACTEASSGGVVRRLTVDACGLQCPGPIMKVSEGIKALGDGGELLVRATDPAFASDIHVWCERTGNELLSVENRKGTYEVLLKKGVSREVCPITAPAALGNDKTMVIFSGDLDKAIAAFIIANGAAAMDRKVTLFFTFWGLNILRRDEKVSVSKNLVEKMFGFMMPRGSRKLALSRMNMGGMGARMIKSIMKKKNVASLEELIRSAMDNGVRVVACQMSMDLMGIHKEELIDGVEIGGVATFLGSAETSDTNLFI